MIKNSGNVCELCIISAGCWVHWNYNHAFIIDCKCFKIFPERKRKRRKRIEDVMLCFIHNALRVAVQIINISEALLIPRWASISFKIIIITTTTIEGINFAWFWHKCARSHENLLAHEILIANSDKKGVKLILENQFMRVKIIHFKILLLHFEGLRFGTFKSD